MAQLQRTRPAEIDLLEMRNFLAWAAAAMNFRPASAASYKGVTLSSTGLWRMASVSCASFMVQEICRACLTPKNLVAF